MQRQTEIGAIAQSLRGGDSKVRKVVRDEEGHAPAWRYAQAALYTVGDLVGAFLGVNKGTPLQRRLSQLAVLLFFVAVLFAIIVFSANRWVTTNEVILYAVATGLSMVPASLVVVLTITLAGGTRAMVRRNVIVRELNSLEALGAVTDICSDKTGTLTQGKMVCRAAWVPSRGTITVGQNNEPFNPTIGDLSFSELEPTAKNKKADKSSEGKPDKAQDKHHDDGAESSSSATRTDENEEQQEKKATTGSKNESTMSYQDIVKDRPEIERFLDAASLCNLATVVAPKDNDDEVEEGEEKQKGWSARGDPTECAIQVFAHRFDWGREKKTQGDEAPWSKQLYEFPFDSDVKRMSVIYASKSEKEKKYVFTKGAVERLLEACTSILNKPGEEPETLDDAGKERVLANVEALAEQGLRVLALATKPWDGSTEDPKRDEVEKDLTLLGLVGLYDPPRPETKGAVAKCHTAGIHVHMLTGDHAATARAIALEVGILPRNIHQFPKNVVDSMVMTAAQFDKLSDEQVDELPVLPLVIARCAPQTKVRMVDALHRRKAFCAMTGDGVNDSPSLKRADVGIAMGMNGSDVAKDASDIVLSDDNFASILAAIEEGRRMFDNIQKFLLQLLAENIAQAFTLLIGLAFKDPQGISVFPLAPVEILWIIMITSGFPAMGLGMQKASSDIMTRPPHSIKTGAFTTEIIVDMFVYGIMSGIIPLMGFVRPLPSALECHRERERELTLFACADHPCLRLWWWRPRHRLEQHARRLRGRVPGPRDRVRAAHLARAHPRARGDRPAPLILPLGAQDAVPVDAVVPRHLGQPDALLVRQRRHLYHLPAHLHSRHQRLRVQARAHHVGVGHHLYRHHHLHPLLRAVEVGQAHLPPSPGQEGRRGSRRRRSPRHQRHLQVVHREPDADQPGIRRALAGGGWTSVRRP